jgi:hypothetical protein
MFRKGKNVFVSGLVIAVMAAGLVACQASQTQSSASTSSSTSSSGQQSNSGTDNQPANGLAAPSSNSSASASNQAPSDNSATTSDQTQTQPGEQTGSVATWNLDAATQQDQAFNLSPATWVMADLGRSQQMHQALADSLGLSVADLDKQLWEDGSNIGDIMSQQGLTEEELKAAVNDAESAAIEGSVTDGTLTQDQADWLNQHMPDVNTFDLAVDPLGTSLMHQAVADALGLSIEDLDKQLWQDNMTLWEIVDAQGMTHEEFQTAVMEAHGKAVQQALADGLITPKQAEILSGQESGA